MPRCWACRCDHENPRYAFVRAPHSVIIGCHSGDAKNPGGVPGTTPCWEVADFDAALATLLTRGAMLHRGPGVTATRARSAADRPPQQRAGPEPGETVNPPR